jgi:hypothetical protein
MAPLHRNLMNAHRVFLIDDCGDTKVYDNLYDKLVKWGRWEIVQDREAADLLLVFSKRQDYYGAMNTGSLSVNPQGTYGTMAGTSIPIMSDQRFLIAVDAKNNEKLLTISCERRIGSGYTARVLVNRMKDRIEKFEKNTK